MSLTQKLSQILRMNLPKGWTSVSYAIMKDGEILAAEAIGNSGGKEKKPSTINDTYNVASVSKVLCALSVMKLVEQGKVTLDTPVYEYLPRFYMPDDRYKQITLRHCLAHSSGLPGTQWKGFSVVDVSVDEYYDETYEYYAHNRLKAAPGEYSVYCNDGFTLAEIVVATVSGMRFSAFCEKYITAPLGAKTTQLSDQLSGENTLVRDGEKPAELLYIQGGAGYTTSMVDLCKIGNLFLNPQGVFEQSSLDEMAKMQGVTNLPMDERSVGYGLGWDNVNMKDPDYDLGEGALQKGGNSFQFTSQFIVIPKYNAVLAISETHNCKIDVSETILRLFATAMLDLGTNIYTKQVPIPQEIIEKYSGTYLMPSGLITAHMYGTTLNVTRDSVSGESFPFYKNARYNGEAFEWENNQTLSFAQHNGETYLMNEFKGRKGPAAQKAKSFAPLSAAWSARLGKKYICISATPYDLVIHDIMTGFEVCRLPGFEGALIAKMGTVDSADIYNMFEGPFIPLDDMNGAGFMNTPSNGSRDLLNPMFEVKDGVEHCYIASFYYRDAASLPVYNGQGFHQGKVNMAYTIDSEIKSLPEIPNGRRIMILNENLDTNYDSLYGSEFKAVNKGYIIFI